MNKKETLEIRKLFKPEDPRVDRICTCYVDGEKKKVATMKNAVLALSEEELHKYTDIMKKTLSGQVGKNLLNLEFPLTEETEGGKQQMLLALRDSELKDDELLDQFYDKVIETFLEAENYLIMLVHGAYDVPGRASDNLVMDDASDYVYSFILCSICPVPLSKPGLAFDPGSSTFVEKLRDRMLEMPETGFLFPAFNDRQTDIHSLLYYSKNPELLHPEITEDLLGVEVPMTAGDQKSAFDTIIEDTFSDHCSFEVAKTVHENMNALLEGKKEEPEPTPLGKTEIRKFLADCGAESGQLEQFDKSFEEKTGGKDELLASNIASPKRFEVKSDDVKISITSARTDLIETRMIDGAEYILIPVTDNVEVNGIRIRAGASDQS